MWYELVKLGLGSLETSGQGHSLVVSEFEAAWFWLLSKSQYEHFAVVTSVDVSFGSALEGIN